MENPMGNIRFRNILFALDFSPVSARTVSYVKSLQHQYGAQVQLVSVLDVFPYERRTDSAASKILVDLRARARNKMRTFMQEHELDAKRYKAVLPEGDVVAAIVKLVKRNAADLVILSTQGRSGARRVCFGSVAEEIFRTVPCPVVTVGPAALCQHHGSVQHILFAYHFTKASRRALPYVDYLLRTNPASDVTLAHFLPSGGEGPYHLHYLRERAQLALRGLMPALQTRISHVVVERESTVEGILDTARGTGADIIVLGVRRGGALARLQTHGLRSITYRIVANAPCPVLTIRS
jgi:nucleotide-binding universal stress UspA family protein